MAGLSDEEWREELELIRVRAHQWAQPRFAREVKKLCRQLDRGEDITGKVKDLCVRLREARDTFLSDIHEDERSLVERYPIGQRVKLKSGSGWHTGRVQKYIRPGGFRVRLKIKIQTDLSSPITLALQRAEARFCLQPVAEDAEVLVPADVAERQKEQSSLSVGDWVEFTTAWRTVQAEVRKLSPDGSVKLRYDGGLHVHSPASLKKIERPPL